MTKKENEITPHNCGFWMYINVMLQNNHMQQSDVDQMLSYIEQFASLNNISFTRLVEFLNEIKHIEDQSFFSKTDEFMQENHIEEDKTSLGEASFVENG